VALNISRIGRTVTREPVTICRDDVVAFARALGFGDGIYCDVDTARRAGHPDVVAPPTYAVALSAAAAHDLLDDPDLGLDYARVVHGEQGLRLVEEIHAGDTLTASSRLAGIRVAGKHELIETETSLTRPDGTAACVLRSVTVSRGTAEGQGS
jgi:acyl dehydratase